jgi:ribosome maturation protein SDO1
MVDIEDAIIARLESHGESFEVLIDTDVARELREGNEVEDISKHMAIEEIFRDAGKEDRASEEKMMEVFETTDVLEIAREIILNGEVQLTTEQRREMQEEKRKQIVTEIARNAINPQTKMPHPPQRIELAMEEARVNVDPFKSVETQVPKVLERLRPLIPIRFEKSKIAVKLPGPEYGRCYEDIVHFGKILKEEWQSNGDWIGVVEIPAGVRDEFVGKLKNRTHGNVETKLIS